MRVLQLGVGSVGEVRGQVPGPGVFAPEQIDPAPFLELMTDHGTPRQVIDLPVDEELTI